MVFVGLAMRWLVLMTPCVVIALPNSRMPCCKQASQGSPAVARSCCEQSSPKPAPVSNDAPAPERERSNDPAEHCQCTLACCSKAPTVPQAVAVALEETSYFAVRLPPSSPTERLSTDDIFHPPRI